MTNLKLLQKIVGFTLTLLLTYSSTRLAIQAQSPEAKSVRPPDTLDFGSLTPDKGLSNPIVYDIVQDKVGFMWFATREGLNKYDGQTFTIYRPDPANPNNPQATGGALEQLYRQVLSGNVAEIHKQLDKIEHSDDVYAQFVAELRHLTHHFRLKQVRERIKQYQEESHA